MRFEIQAFNLDFISVERITKNADDLPVWVKRIFWTENNKKTGPQSW